MIKTGQLWALVVVGVAISSSAMPAQDSATAEKSHALHIDVPVKIEQANIVVDIGHAIFVGDMPFVFGDLGILAKSYSDGSTKGHLVAVLHGDAAYFVLNNDTYNTNRHVRTGNPFEKIISGLIKQGVQIELCGATAQANQWGNADLISGVKVDTDAMVRVTQLEQEGYTLIYE
ncbi:DsrE/DsrF-like family protein [Bryocella elongata]|uniref:DsrE/DsrF-like family protein n=1 Tax=Bryocella elongata TaxID=863522 RepID=A0A1H6C9C6_9BACT|nr:DsrE family protein [Bryocella elongata]SEG69225.1 DsrE/DsrF-like family protein [Bryocella elongata]